MNGTFNARCLSHKIFDEATLFARIHAQHVVQYQYLSVGIFARADADGGTNFE